MEENLKKLLYLLESIEDAIVVLPEMFLCGFDYEKIREHARSALGVVERLKLISEEKKLTIVGSIPEEGTEGKLFNNVFVMSEGKLVGKRSKIKLFPIYEENKYFSPGVENPVFETRHGKVGVLVCFELRFANLGWDLRRKGAQIIAVPSMWGARRKEHLKVLSRARAIELQSFLLLSNAWGKTGDEEYAGCSAIYDPWGNVLAFSEEGESLLVSWGDMKKVEAVRRLIPVDIEII